MIATMNEGVVDMLEYKDDGYIELIFKLLARICDGQHFGLQVQYISHNYVHVDINVFLMSPGGTGCSC